MLTNTDRKGEPEASAPQDCAAPRTPPWSYSALPPPSGTDGRNTLPGLGEQGLSALRHHGCENTLPKVGRSTDHGWDDHV